MKIPIFLTALFLAFGLGAQSISFNTGDKSLDVYLNDINVQAKADLTLFNKNLTAEFSISNTKITEYSKIMQPAEIYYSLQIAIIIGKPVETVVTTYKTHKGKGWGVIAKELGIKPGSAEFHKLKDAAKGKSAKGKPGKKSTAGGKTKPNGTNGKKK
ncbi:MAG: hypothetical protein ACO1O6_09490 [Bacteroidota bacterium]